MCSIASKSSPLRARRSGVSGPLRSTVISGSVPGEEEGGTEPALGAPAGSLESDCTWPLQARIFDLRFRPPVVLSTLRKSSIFLAAWPGEFRLFVICTGTILDSVSSHEQISFQVSYISRIYDFLWIKDSRNRELAFSLYRGAYACP